MTSLAEQQRQGFQDRLRRIQDGGPNTIRQVHIGPSEEIRAKDARARTQAKLSQVKPKKLRTGSSSGDILMAPIAIAFGAFAVFIGRAAAFQFFSADGAYAFQFAGMPSTMFMDFVIAAVLATLFAKCFQLNYGLRRAFLMTGFVAMMVGESFLLHKYPQVFTTFYSDTYVLDTLATTPTLL